MPGRPKNYDRIKEAHESKTNPTKVTREVKRMTCSNCKQTGHNCGTCTLQAAPEIRVCSFFDLRDFWEIKS